MPSIAEDIVLLAIKPNGTLAAYEKLRFALASSELIRLAEMGRIDIDHDGYVIVLDTSPTGDDITDEALTALDNRVFPPRARDWVARQPAVLVNKYLSRLAADYTIRPEDRKVLGLSRGRRWTVVNAAKLIDAKYRLDAIASSTAPVTPQEAVFAGLVYAVGLGAQLYPKHKNLAKRARLEAIARQDESTKMVASASNSPSSASEVSDYTLANAQAWSAIQSSVNAAHHASAHHNQTGHGGGSYDGGGHHGGGGGGHHG